MNDSLTFEWPHDLPPSPLVIILNQMKLIHIVEFNFFNTHFNIIPSDLQFGLYPSDSRTKML